MELIKVENLFKVYGKGENKVRAVDGVSFSVPKGQMVAIIGAIRQHIQEYIIPFDVSSERI